MNTMTTENTASQKQIDFIKRLVAEREVFDYDPENAAANVVAAQDQPEAYVAGVTVVVARQMWREGQFTTSVASQTIEALLAAPEKPKAQPDGSVSFVPVSSPAAGPAGEGMHKFGGVIFKVQRAVHGSGRLYAKALLEDGNGGWRFEYAASAIKNLSAATALSLEEAQQFGVLYGTCCVCGRTLTNEDSIQMGIGPVCMAKF